jgi:hypothetical protein
VKNATQSDAFRIHLEFELLETAPLAFVKRQKTAAMIGGENNANKINCPVGKAVPQGAFSLTIFVCLRRLSRLSQIPRFGERYASICVAGNPEVSFGLAGCFCAAD